MEANSSGLENNHTGKLNAGASKKWPTLPDISNHITASVRNSIPQFSKLISVSQILFSVCINGLIMCTFLLSEGN
ncbi:hypothetical protein H5410_037795 [Solanum commersonii]|uniref:Uncharacterized protein n=1 Tax=Solanum commersonii TaxID=4109 RepID=A0A9J5Y797_SOLCO|nr:hypothetical protein H5410_037795 [Solanum commersonii]